MSLRRCSGAIGFFCTASPARLLALPALALVSAAACTSSPREADPPARQPLVVLGIWHGPAEVPRAPIQGSAACRAPIELDPICIEDDRRLAEEVLQCGSPQVTIDRSYSHVTYVHFPAGLHRRFEAIPSDLDIVRCVRGRVGFRFAAGIARDASMLVEADQGPFAELHAEP